jgi:hypothetical protein
LVLDPGANASVLSDGVNTWQAGDNIDFAGQSIVSVDWHQNKLLGANLPGGTLDVELGSGLETIAINTGTYANGNFQILGSDISFELACFASGTRIDTLAGPVAVEDLRVGDELLLASGLIRSVKWIGWRHIDITRHTAARRVRPIRVRANAIEDGVPRQDVLLSPDHALFLDGKLIPVRLLRNDTTIREEHGCQSVTYYHVELDAHDVILAEGMPTESYLDTGNRAVFENSDMPTLLHPDFNSPDGQARRESESCAPLANGAAVEPIWRTLMRRGETLGYVSPPSLPKSNNPGLYLSAGGSLIPPVASTADCHSFVIPKAAGSVRLVSLSFIPSDLEPWDHDDRRLGVAVSRMTLWRNRDLLNLSIDDPKLADGWWAPETDGQSFWRWTDGNAELGELAGGTVLEIEVSQSKSVYPSTFDRAAEPALANVA